MKIYELLLNNRRPHLIMPSREYLSFQEHEALLSYLPDVMPYKNEKDDFSLIGMNILIEGVKNYLAMQDLLKDNKKADIAKNLSPLFTFNDVAIYCPLFSVSSNLLIANGLGNKLTITNDFIDTFETYNFALFESRLTSLVHVGSDLHTRAYYHYDFHTIYIVNDQGRLDVKICLFDRNLAHPDYRNILERIKSVVAAYYAADQKAFIAALYNEKLISAKIFNKYNNKLKSRK